MLRAPTASDAPRLAPLIDDFDIARMTTRIPHPYGLADAEAFLAGQQAIDAGIDRTLHVETQAGELIGAVGAHLRDGPFPEIGYWIAREHWGPGLRHRGGGGDPRTGRGACSAAGRSSPAISPTIRPGGGCWRSAASSTPARCSSDSRWARGEEATTRMMVWLA